MRQPYLVTPLFANMQTQLHMWVTDALSAACGPNKSPLDPTTQSVTFLVGMTPVGQQSFCVIHSPLSLPLYRVARLLQLASVQGAKVGIYVWFVVKYLRIFYFVQMSNLTLLIFQTTVPIIPQLKFEQLKQVPGLLLENRQSPQYLPPFISRSRSAGTSSPFLAAPVNDKKLEQVGSQSTIED